MRLTLGAGITQADKKFFGLEHGADLSRIGQRIPLQLQLMFFDFPIIHFWQQKQQAVT